EFKLACVVPFNNGSRNGNVPKQKSMLAFKGVLSSVTLSKDCFGADSGLTAGDVRYRKADIQLVADIVLTRPKAAVWSDFLYAVRPISRTAEQ
ncbi:hypothetical protein, partial [Mesorhizobium sp. B2-7-1]|uniref:hypothetical protein n=1 Tax=Mesorhizobium sp. B2-7-1 TaxID=2589909 RepID=UPI001AED4234